VAVDASGTFSETKRQVGLLRMLQAGVILSDYATLMVEILKDNAPPEAGATVPSTCPGRNSSGRLTVSKWWSWEQSSRRDKPGYDPTHLRRRTMPVADRSTKGVHGAR
jgi:hypothetical protein